MPGWTPRQRRRATWKSCHKMYRGSLARVRNAVAAAKRRRKYALNRQQKLSVKTVKQIAKEVSQKLPEMKLYENLHYTSARYVIQSPTDPNDKYISKKLFDATTIPQGTGENERIGNKIRVKGIRLKVMVDLPRNQETRQDQAGFRAGAWNELHVRLVSLTSDGGLDVNPPSHAGDIRTDLWATQRDLNMKSNDARTPRSHFNKTISLKSKPANLVSQALQEVSDVYQITTLPSNLNEPDYRFYDWFIPMDMPITFTGAGTDDWKRLPFLWIYNYGLNQHIPADSDYWGGDINFALRVSYSYSVYYIDA